jgi:hypothetical protein
MKESNPTLFERLKRSIENNPVLAIILAAAFLISAFKPVFSLVEPWTSAMAARMQRGLSKPESTSQGSTADSPAVGLPGECKQILFDAYATTSDSALVTGELTLRFASYEVHLNGDGLRRPTIFVLKLLNDLEPIIRAEAVFVPSDKSSPSRQYDTLMYLSDAERYEIYWPKPGDKYNSVFKYEPLSQEDFRALAGDHQIPSCSGIAELVTRVR